MTRQLVIHGCDKTKSEILYSAEYKGTYIYVLSAPIASYWGHVGHNVQCFTCEKDLFSFGIEKGTVIISDSVKKGIGMSLLLIDESNIKCGYADIENVGMRGLIDFFSEKEKDLIKQNEELKKYIELYKSTKEFIEQAKELSS